MSALEQLPPLGDEWDAVQADMREQAARVQLERDVRAIAASGPVGVERLARELAARGWSR